MKLHLSQIYVLGRKKSNINSQRSEEKKKESGETGLISNTGVRYSRKWFTGRYRSRE